MHRHLIGFVRSARARDDFRAAFGVHVAGLPTDE